MSNGGGGCGCGSNCKCGSGCSCGMYPDVEESSTVTIIEGVAVKMYTQGSEEGVVAEGGNGCKCGSNCTCDPCNC